MAIHVKCSFSINPYKEDFAHWVIPLEIDVLADGDDYEEHLIGKIGADRVLWNGADNAGYFLGEVCDEDSQGLYEVWAVTTQEGGDNSFVFEIQKEMGKRSAINDVIFIHKTLIHEEFSDYAQGIINTVCKLFGTDSITVTWNTTTKLPWDELAEIGFRELKKTFSSGNSIEILFRPGTCSSEYDENYPSGCECDEYASPEHEEWVMEHWKD